MSTNHSPAVDDKDGLRGELDLSEAVWHRVQPEGETVEYTFVAHTDGVTYVALRQTSDPGGVVLIFTPSEWDAFLAGVRDGEFDRPA
ncbi:DUF397 domain-containing protein [Prauserella cavernicola]|uniref:DUF397 domain-containing protein n=1 Tax=Prauserella cavernicola TaxID=2800127 RepID=A0A934QWI9_9PSEU|nr:DUF397 domain-containing protein [Prauserella cavernicola]MBK1786874.1 DUF397 domain-containing protein [Prauserella cavernicola]